MPERTEPRLAKESTVRIFGLDSKGHPVNLPANTIDISKHGARLTGVKCWDYPGETIGVRCGAEKARFRIVWIGLPNTPVEGQVGLSCLDHGKYIFDTEPPAEDPNAERMPVPIGMRAVGNQIGLGSAAQQYADRRRKDQRFVIQGGANVREVGKNVPQWTTLHDLSIGGCYVETTAPFPAHSRVDITIQVGDLRIDARGSVTVKHPLVGMGIKFADMSPMNRERLRHLVANLQQTGSQSAD